jgi:hypothetical protein
MVIARMLLADWRRAFKISSMSAFPDAEKGASPGSDQTPVIKLGT